MAQTITITEEAQAFFVRNPDKALKALVDLGVKEYGEFMGDLPLIVDALEDPETGFEEVWIAVEADSSKGLLRDRQHEFMNCWRPRHSREELRAVGFSYRYR